MGVSADSAQEGILPFFLSVRERLLQPEIMDRQDLDPGLRKSALRGLERINIASRTAATIRRAIRACDRRADRPLRVLDLACGGGDVAIALSRHATRDQVPMEIHGADKSADTVAYASERANSSVHFFQLDVMHEPIPEGYDVIYSTLFMHHLDDEGVVHLLTSMRAASPRLIVISDLRRAALGYAIAHIACRALTRSYVVHYDGPRSVAAAYTPEEFSVLANRAGLIGHQIRNTWPFRFLFTWSPP